MVLQLYSSQAASPEGMETIEFTQGMLRDVGIEVEVTFFDRAAYRDSVTKPPDEAMYNMVVMGVGTFPGDAEYIMVTFYACDSAAPRYYNRAYFCDEEVDALIEKSKTIPDMEGRNAVYADVIKKVFDTAPIIQLYDVISTVAMRSYVKGVYFDPPHVNWMARNAWLDK
jgi:ABC-type transport system substrate-binding protein